MARAILTPAHRVIRLPRNAVDMPEDELADLLDRMSAEGWDLISWVPPLLVFQRAEHRCRWNEGREP